MFADYRDLGSQNQGLASSNAVDRLLFSPSGFVLKCNNDHGTVRVGNARNRNVQLGALVATVLTPR